jgi:hypothetical protein
MRLQQFLSLANCQDSGISRDLADFRIEEMYSKSEAIEQ